MLFDYVTIIMRKTVTKTWARELPFTMSQATNMREMSLGYKGLREVE